MMMRARRLTLAFAAVLILGLTGLVLRLGWLQTSRHASAAEHQISQSTRTLTRAARRGDVFDRNGRPLAQSVKELEVSVWPPNILKEGTEDRDSEAIDASVATITEFLAPRLRMSPAEIEQALRGTRNRRLGPPIGDADLIEELEAESRDKLRRLDLTSRWSRGYPWGAVGGNLLGFIGHEGSGVCGIERGLEAVLAGVDGLSRHRVDMLRRPMWSPEDEEVHPLDGLDVQLTVDIVLQQFLEEELVEAVKTQAAAGAAGVLMDTATGDVLALASVPLLDSADFSQRVKDAYRHRALEDLYAPGSTFKPIMMAAALDMGLVTPETRIDCRSDRGHFGRRVVTDSSPQQRDLTPEEILIHSSNIGMGSIFTRLVPEDDTRNTDLMAPVHAALISLGLGRPTGLSLPYEAAGRVSPLKDWTRNYTLVSVSFGYELGVTVVQMGAAVATLADGFYRAPRLVSSVRTSEGWRPAKPVEPRPVFAPATAATVRSWMAQVVEQGSGRAAAQPGVPVAGKTGTSYKESDRRKENHSFVALVPADSPRLVLVIMLDDPQNGRYSSQTTVPVAGRILSKTLAYLGETP